MLLNILEGFPNDTGPIYQETIQGRFPVEPFNTFSNLVFLIIIIYFFIKIRNKPKEHPFFLFAIPVTFVGWIGGTIYHGTRSHQIWLLLDWMPIMLVCLGGIFYYISKTTKSNWKRVLIAAGLFTLLFILSQVPMPEEYRTSFGYSTIALIVLTPFVWYAYKTRWRDFHLILIAIFLFTIAITFRTLDNTMTIFAMGTHWLWHTFGGASVFFVLLYTLRDRKRVLILS